MLQKPPQAICENVIANLNESINLYIVILIPGFIFGQDTSSMKGNYFTLFGDTLKYWSTNNPQNLSSLDLTDKRILDTLYNPFSIIYISLKSSSFLPQEEIQIAVKNHKNWTKWTIYLSSWDEEEHSNFGYGYINVNYDFERKQINKFGFEELIINTCLTKSINYCPDDIAYREHYCTKTIWNLDERIMYLSVLTDYEFDAWCNVSEDLKETKICEIETNNGNISINLSTLKFELDGELINRTSGNNYQYTQIGKHFVLKK